MEASASRFPRVPVPASYNDIFADSAVRDHVGDAWYQTTARIPERWRGERIVLRFDSATHRAVVWVDETQVAEHEGGYTPFEADITDVVEPGARDPDHRGRRQPPRLGVDPAGRVVETPDGPRHSLLLRLLQLRRPPSIGLALHDPRLLRERHHGGHRSRRLDRDRPLRDRGGRRRAARSASRSGTRRATKSRRRRAPPAGSPLRTSIHGARARATCTSSRWSSGHGDDAVDVYTLPVGIRTVRVDGTRFLINEEPFYFTGFGKHEDGPVRGKGHDDAFMVHDFALLDWLGANSFRTSHYPYAEEWLEYADRHGIVVIDETPAVGINSGLAGGVFGAEPFTTFSPDTIGPATQEAHRQAIRELSRATRTIPASCSGPSRTSRSRSRPRRAPTSSRSRRRRGGSIRHARLRSPT